MMLAWGAKVSPLFRLKVAAIATACAFNPDWLMAAMAFETGRTFSPSVRNPNSSATGLIQFMDATARGLGTTVEELARMTAEEQIDVVARYFKPFAGRILSLADCYMAILYPHAIGLPEHAVIFPPGSREYLVNRGLDLDHDGAVTKAEAAAKVAALLAEGLRPENVADSDTQPAAPIEDVDLSNVPQRKEEPMATANGNGFGSVLTGLAGVATAINPLAGLIVGLGGQLLQAFSPETQTKFNDQLAKNGSKPDVIAGVMSNLVDLAKQATGKDDPVQAVAATTADPAVLQKVEVDAVKHIEQMSPIFDKLSDLDQKTWAAEELSRSNAREGAKADSVDLGPVLAYSAITSLFVVLLLLLIALGIQIYFDDSHTPDPTLITLLSTVIGVTVAKYSTLFDYRFGSSRSSSAKDAVITELSKKPAP